MQYLRALNDTFQLNFTPRPTANNTILTLCEAMTGSGTTDFTLTNADATVTDGTAGVSVTYHTTLADAQGDTNLSVVHTILLQKHCIHASKTQQQAAIEQLW